MSETGNRKTAPQLDEALRLLDHELTHLELEEPLQIRAIGGYALLKHGVRTHENAYTVDIDTVTRDYSEAVIRAIEKVASEAGLDVDWLNNYNLMGEPEDVEGMFDAEWLPQPMDLRNIAVSIASIPTLTRSKIMAADTAEFSGRQRDAGDLKDLLDHQGITNLAQFKQKYPDPFGEFPEAQRLVTEHLAPGLTGADTTRPTKNSARFPELDDVRLDPYGFDGDDASFDGLDIDWDEPTQYT